MLCIATHRSWVGMRQRCSNPKTNAYESYGGRGISFCKRWDSFENFVEDMGVRPANTSLDRIDVNGNYELSNCRWAGRKEQGLNRRTTRKITIEGKEYFACELSKEFGLKTDTILERHSQGLTLNEILAPERRVYHAGLALGGMASGRVKMAKTHCSRGHELNEKNTAVTKQGWRKCRSCALIRQNIYNQKKEQAENRKGI